jgi:hypothetical protein
MKHSRREERDRSQPTGGICSSDDRRLLAQLPKRCDACEQTQTSPAQASSSMRNLPERRGPTSRVWQAKHTAARISRDVSTHGHDKGGRTHGRIGGRQHCSDDDVSGIYRPRKRRALLRENKPRCGIRSWALVTCTGRIWILKADSHAF